MLSFLESKRKWLTVSVLFLLILEIMTFPYVVGSSFADRSDSPEHTLSYTPGSLKWSSAKGVNDSGAAIFGIFDTKYMNKESRVSVRSVDGDYVVAPGTESGTIVRLMNNSSRSISYHAVMYMTESPATLPVKAKMTGLNMTDCAFPYSLPSGIVQNNIVRAVTGSVNARYAQDFDLSWLWDFSPSQAQDVVDTYLGNRSAKGDPGTVSIGFYIVVVEDDSVSGGGSVLPPDVPKTGDEFTPGLYMAALGLSLIALAFLALEFIWERRRQC